MVDLVVEIHVPLTPANVPEGEYEYPWIETIMDFLMDLDGKGRGELWDDGEALGEDYVFPVIGAPEADLIGLAREVANLPGVPTGVFALVTDTDADMGTGRRVDLE